MSDGLSDCAELAHQRANDFAKEKYPKAMEINGINDAPRTGDAFVIKEDYMTHILTIVRNRKVIHRYMVPPYGDIIVCREQTHG